MNKKGWDPRPLLIVKCSACEWIGQRRKSVASTWKPCPKCKAPVKLETKKEENQ